VAVFSAGLAEGGRVEETVCARILQGRDGPQVDRDFTGRDESLKRRGLTLRRGAWKCNADYFFDPQTKPP
jgi:hypothetical protein